MKKPRLKKNDLVVVISGRDRGRQGKILRVIPSKDRVIVERVNLIKKHTKPNPQRNIAGGISEKEAPIHISNVMLIDPQSGKPTRVGRKRLEDGSGTRVAKKSGATLS